MSSGLNAGQKAAADGFLGFLFGEDKELIISGPGGSGKTFLLGHMIDEIMPLYEKTASVMGVKTKYHAVNMVATTHKAAEALGNSTNYSTSTVHQLLGLTLFTDFNTGKTKLTRKRNSEPVENQIIVCDEASFVDGALYKYADTIPYNCKIIWVMDHCQLPPVAADMVVQPNSSRKAYYLTEPMRNKGQPALIKLCEELRNSIDKNTPTPDIELVEGVIDLFSGADLKEYIDNHFKDPFAPVEARILGYTNAKVINYNKYIRQLRKLPNHFVEGETLVSNGMLRTNTYPAKILARTEQEVVINSMSEPYDHIIDKSRNASILVRDGSFTNSLGERTSNIQFVEDIDHLRKLVSYYQKVAKQTHDWSMYYYLKECFPDFRDNNASTVHKSQGSTYDVSIIDLDDLGRCFQPDLLRRLLYVAVSRARNRVIFYGNLPKALGNSFYGNRG